MARQYAGSEHNVLAYTHGVRGVVREDQGPAYAVEDAMIEREGM